jgi:hypothetical protein
MYQQWRAPQGALDAQNSSSNRCEQRASVV